MITAGRKREKSLAFLRCFTPLHLNIMRNEAAACRSAAAITQRAAERGSLRSHRFPNAAFFVFFSRAERVVPGSRIRKRCFVSRDKLHSSRLLLIQPSFPLPRMAFCIPLELFNNSAGIFMTYNINSRSRAVNSQLGLLGCEYARKM